MVKVYHNRNFSNYMLDKKMPTSNDLTLVAEVDTDNLDVAYTLTNSIDEYWWDNDGVDAIVTHTRSTSCGDVMNVGDDWYIVASVGFEKIDNPFA